MSSGTAWDSSSGIAPHLNALDLFRFHRRGDWERSCHNGSVLLQNDSVLSLYQHWSSSALQEKGRVPSLLWSASRNPLWMFKDWTLKVDIYWSKWSKDKNQHHVTSQHCEHHAPLLIVQKKDLEKKHRLCLVNLFLRVIPVRFTSARHLMWSARMRKRSVRCPWRLVYVEIV